MMTDTERLAIALKALHHIDNPASFLADEEPWLSDNATLMMVAIKNPFTYIGIARRALRQLGEVVD